MIGNRNTSLNQAEHKSHLLKCFPVLLALVTLISFYSASKAAALPPAPILISAGQDSTPGNDYSYHPSVTPDGSKVAFASAATNLVSNDTNSANDVFVRNITNGTTEIASVNNQDQQGNDYSIAPSISADGRYVLFSSYSSNLGGNGSHNVSMYLRDTLAGTTKAITLSNLTESISEGDQAISADGRYSVYTGRVDKVGSTLYEAYLYDNQTGATTLLSNGIDGQPGDDNQAGDMYTSISPDGRHISFKSYATNLVENSPPDGSAHHYLYDTTTGAITLLTAAPATGSVTFSSNDRAVFSAIPSGSRPAVLYLDDLSTGAIQALPVLNGGLGSFINYSGTCISYQVNSSIDLYNVTNGVNKSIADNAAVPAPVTEDCSKVVYQTLNDDYSLSQIVMSQIQNDTTPPTISYTISPTPNSNGWNSGSVVITFTCNDTDSGVASCPGPIFVTSEGANQRFSGTAADNAGNTASVTTVPINNDETAPTLGTSSWDINPVISGQSATLTVPPTDNLSGIAGGEYYLGTTDPGAGNGTALIWDGTKLTGSLGSSLSPGMYTVNVRAQDNAGNWSSVSTTNLVVNSASVAPVITSASSYSTSVRQLITPANFTVRTTGTPTPTLSESGALPSGLSFTDNGNGTANFTGMVAAGTAGTYHITITATNSGGSATQSFALTITNADSAPTAIFASPSNLTITKGVSMTPVTFTSTGNGTNFKIFVSSGSLPPGLNLHDNKDGTASLFGTPTTKGIYTFTLRASNNVGIFTQSFTITVN